MCVVVESFFQSYWSYFASSLVLQAVRPTLDCPFSHLGVKYLSPTKQHGESPHIPVRQEQLNAHSPGTLGQQSTLPSVLAREWYPGAV